jgi:hypothetical protein
LPFGRDNFMLLWMHLSAFECILRGHLFVTGNAKVNSAHCVVVMAIDASGKSPRNGVAINLGDARDWIVGPCSSHAGTQLHHHVPRLTSAMKSDLR